MPESRKRPISPDDIAELLYKAKEHKEPMRIEVDFDGNCKFEVYVTKLRLQAFDKIIN